MHSVVHLMRSWSAKVTIYAPMIYTAPCVRFLMRTGPYDDFQRQPPPPLPHVFYLPTSKNLRAGTYKSLVHRWFYEYENALIVFPRILVKYYESTCFIINSLSSPLLCLSICRYRIVYGGGPQAMCELFFFFFFLRFAL
jgi:hypothetical protein